ncbi:MAG TPA: uridine kinase [Candidatus Tectomicrobia bacterium]|nr:uridine kinase [Candidatus Tectomicrobia bacterium]
MASRTPFVVGIAGGSGSGKTSLACALAAALGPRRVALLAHDAYYRDHGALPPDARAALDFDAPEAFDQPLFRAHLRALRAGRAVRPPHYCFTTHRRLGPGDPVRPRHVLLVEGILLLHDPLVRAALDLAIFLDVPEAVRLARRCARDVVERGRTRESVLAQFAASVRPAHVRFVEPTKAHADLVLAGTGSLDRLVEIATAVIRDRLARQAGPLALGA